MARNKFDIDEKLETEFNLEHLKRCGKYIKKHAGKLIGAFLLNVLAILLSLVSPLVIKQAMDVTIPAKNIRELIFLAGLLVVIYLITVLLITAKSRITAMVGQRIVHEIREDLFSHLQKLPFTYYDDRPHGKILVRVVQYVNNVSDMLSNGILNMFLDVINLFFIGGFMLFVDVKLACVIFCGLPVLVIIMCIIKPHQRKAWQTVSNKNSNLNAYLQESINGVKITQLYAREDENEEIFNTQNELAKKTWIKASLISNTNWLCVENISQIISSMVYLVGVLWLVPAVSVGTIVAMGNYSWRFWQPIQNLANFYNQLINTLAYLERIFETMDEPVVITDCEGAEPMPEIKGDVTFSHVTFGYEKGHDILKDVSFTVKAGESVALVGPTGAGKTTIVNLLSRFYDVDSGQVLIDGQDISKVTLRSLREQMGIMLQDSFIFSGTIADNIRYGKLDASRSEIRYAASCVHADGFIKNMPKGYDTVISERGSQLSQGQRQLLSFARTFISSPKILVLDEATSSIDTKTEALVQEGIQTLLSGRTSFIIAHRLSTIKHCDKIMYIGNGGILESGTHEELMAKKGYYYRLYMSQLEA